MGQSVFQKYAGLSQPRPGGAGVSVFSRFEKLSSVATYEQLLDSARGHLSENTIDAARQALMPKPRLTVPYQTAQNAAAHAATDAAANYRPPRNIAPLTPTVQPSAPRAATPPPRPSVAPESLAPSPYTSTARDSHFPPGIPDAPIDPRSQQPTGSFARESLIPSADTVTPTTSDIPANGPPTTATSTPETLRARINNIVRNNPELVGAGIVGTGVGGYALSGNDQERTASVFSLFRGFTKEAITRADSRILDHRMAQGGPTTFNTPGFEDTLAGRYSPADIQRYVAGKQNAQQIGGARQYAANSGNAGPLELAQKNLIAPQARAQIPAGPAAPALTDRLKSFKANKALGASPAAAAHAAQTGAAVAPTAGAVVRHLPWKALAGGMAAGAGLHYMFGGSSPPPPPNYGYGNPYAKTGSQHMVQSVFAKFSGIPVTKTASVFEQFGGIKEAGNQQRKMQRRAEKLEAKNNPKPAAKPRTYAKPMPPPVKRNAAPADFGPSQPKVSLPPPPIPPVEVPLPLTAKVDEAVHAARAARAARVAAQQAPPPSRGLLRRALLPAALLAGASGIGYGLYQNHRAAEPAQI